MSISDLREVVFRNLALKLCKENYQDRNEDLILLMIINCIDQNNIEILQLLLARYTIYEQYILLIKPIIKNIPIIINYLKNMKCKIYLLEFIERLTNGKTIKSEEIYIIILKKKLLPDEYYDQLYKNLRTNNTSLYSKLSRKQLVPVVEQEVVNVVNILPSPNILSKPVPVSNHVEMIVTDMINFKLLQRNFEDINKLAIMINNDANIVLPIPHNEIPLAVLILLKGKFNIDDSHIEARKAIK